MAARPKLSSWSFFGVLLSPLDLLNTQCLMDRMQVSQGMYTPGPGGCSSVKLLVFFKCRQNVNATSDEQM